MSCTMREVRPTFSEVKTSKWEGDENTVVLDKPIIIEAFFLKDFLASADFTDTFLDSAEVFIESKRQEYYKVMDSHGYYQTMVRPDIDSLEVTILSITDEKKPLVFRTDDNKRYVVKMEAYKMRSGIFLFNGKDAPVYWESQDQNGNLHEKLKDYFR
jgi:hypothetical protein